MTLDQRFALGVTSGLAVVAIGGFLYFQRSVIREQRYTIDLQSKAITIQRKAMQEMVYNIPIVMNMN